MVATRAAETEEQDDMPAHKGVGPRWGCKGQRFIEEDRGHESVCHVWRLSLSGGGYGHVRVGGTLRPAHVVAWEEVNGPVPEGLELDHLCRTRACVRPDHLEPVTRRENARRGAKAKLDHDTVKMIRESRESARSIARRLGINHTTVAAARRGASWR